LRKKSFGIIFNNKLFIEDIMFQIDQKVEDNIAILKISGSMIDSDAGNLIEKVKDLVSTDINKFILELSEVKLMNSCFGLGIILGCWGCTNRANGLLKIANPSPKVAYLLKTTKINQVLEVYDTIEEALLSFKK
jgi:anti-anti-sigma factor